MLRFFSLVSIAFGLLTPLAAEAKPSCGHASWYGPGFDGRFTASGERFNSQALTAAHRSLPFGSRVKVINMNNGKSVILKINDDGPHIPGRIIDLSQGSFSRIAMSSQGVVPVCIAKL